jgi:hypothetical protein
MKGLVSLMRYAIKAKTTKVIRITNANNQDEAIKEYVENYLIINREKT